MIKVFLRLFFVFLCIFATTRQAYALSVIRDTEVESLLLKYMRPIFRAAGLNPQNAQIVIVNDPSINAFVVGGQMIFIHTGLILKAEHPDEVAFVLAHETGHIVGGHVIRGYKTLQEAQTTALISTVLGGLLAVAGGRPDAGIALMMGGQISASGLFLKYRQTEESTADRTAVTIMEKTGYSLSGFEKIMKTIATEERLNAGNNDSYLQTHPMTQTRVSDLSRFLNHSQKMTDDADFDLARAKLNGFLRNPNEVYQLYPKQKLPDKYARAIAEYRENNYADAFALLDELIKEQPENPFFRELKGQFLFETGKSDDAAINYREALRLLPNAPLIRLAYAQVLLELNTPHDTQEAEKILKTLSQQEPDTPVIWEFLAKAYDRQHKNKDAGYAMAEYYHAIGDTNRARKQAKKSLDLFKANPVIQQRLQDIIDIGM